MAECLYFEDLLPGKSWESQARTLTETDIVNFACSTGDFDPLHVDQEFAAESPYRKPIAHGLLGLSLMAGLSSTSPRVRTAALVRIDDWQFHLPIYIGDTIHAVTEVESSRPCGRRNGEVVWLRKLINQRGECVQSGRLTTLVSSRSFIPRASKPSVVPPMKTGQLRPNLAKVELNTHESVG